MKKTIIATLASFLAISCTSFLNVDKIGKATIDSFFAEYGGCVAAGEGLHKELITFYGGSSGNLITYGDATGVTLNLSGIDAGEGEKYVFNFGLLPEHTATYPRSIWKNGYSVISSANYIIYYVDKYLKESALDSEKETCRKILGYGYFARALAHFQLCNCYAQPYCYTPDASHIGIPIVPRIPGFNDEMPRVAVSSVYELVLSDLQKALELFGSETAVKDCTHINGIACEALLARVYLYMGNWKKAEEYSKMVMDKVPLSPRSEYVNMYRSPKANLGKESILRLNLYGTTSSMLSLYDPTRSARSFVPDPSMPDLYDEDDVRRELYTYVGEDCEIDEFKGKAFSAVCKHLPLKSITDPEDGHPYMFILRGSEMYLIHAEALVCGDKHDLTGAADDLKALIARARGVEASQVDLSYSSQADMEALIEKERLRELCYEGHSHFDCGRRGRDIVRFSTTNSTVPVLKYGDYRYIMPIEELEMQANELMVQNEGYTK